MGTDLSRSPAGADPWGHHDPPAVDPAALPPLPARLADLAALDAPRPRRDDDRWPDPRELSEVQDLERAGWRVLDQAPLLASLPALWPRHLRCWVPDRCPPITVEHCTAADGTISVVVRRPTPDEVARDDEDADRCAASAGLPPSPRRRVWLLRSPWPDQLPMPWLLAALVRIGDEQAGPRPDADPLAAAASRLLTDTSPAGAARVLAQWHGADADAATAWRAEPDPPAEHMDLALVGASPQRLAEVRAALAQAGLPAADAARLLLATDPAGALGWVPLLAAGLTTVSELTAEPVRLGPDDAAPLLRAGWTVPDLGDLPDAGSAWDASGWRATGLASHTVGRLLRCRSTLRPGDLDAWAAVGLDAEHLIDVLRADAATVPAQWAPFAATDLPHEVAVDWLAHGFDAEQAVAWEAADVVPAEARVWRARGWQPADVPRLRAGAAGSVPPGGWWVGARGGDRRRRVWSVTDPPGTRGRIAAEQRRDVG